MNVREYFKIKLGEPMDETYETILSAKEVMDIAQECVNKALNQAKNNEVLDLVSKPLDAEVQQVLNEFSKTQGEKQPNKDRF